MSLTSYRAAPPRDGDYRWPLGRSRGHGLVIVKPVRFVVIVVWVIVVWRIGLSADPCSLIVVMDWKTWRRPTLPCLETQYHGRWGISRPSSGWDRVQGPRQSHQVVQSTLEMVVSLQSLVVKRLGWKVLAVCRVRCVAHSRLLQTD